MVVGCGPGPNDAVDQIGMQRSALVGDPLLGYWKYTTNNDWQVNILSDGTATHTHVGTPPFCWRVGYRVWSGITLQPDGTYTATRYNNIGYPDCHEVSDPNGTITLNQTVTPNQFTESSSFITATFVRCPGGTCSSVQ